MNDDQKDADNRDAMRMALGEHSDETSPEKAEIEDLAKLKHTLLDSAELATRASNLAALAGGVMQKATKDLTKASQLQQSLGVIVVAIFVTISVVSIAVSGFVTFRLQERVSQLDAMLVAVGKRVSGLDESIKSLESSGDMLKEITLKQDGISIDQKQISARIDEVMKSIGTITEANAKLATGKTLAADKKPEQDKQMLAIEQKLQAQNESLRLLINNAQRTTVQPDANALRRAAEAAVKLQKERTDQEAAAKAVTAAATAAAAPAPKPKEKLVQYPRTNTTD